MPNNNGKYKNQSNRNKNKGNNYQGNNNQGNNNRGNNNRGNNNRNIYEVCGMVQRFIYNTCEKNNISPNVLYEELHYQLPAEWVNGLRYTIQSSARIHIKREFDISSSESSYESDI